MNRPLVGWLALGSTPASGVAGCAARPAAGATDTQPGLSAAGARDVFREARKTTPGAGVLPMISALPAVSTPHPCPLLVWRGEGVCPNGVMAFSPGLRGTSYPGKSSRKFNNPEGVEAAGTRTVDATPLGLGRICIHDTQGSLADSATLGWRMQPRWALGASGAGGGARLC